MTKKYLFSLPATAKAAIPTRSATSLPKEPPKWETKLKKIFVNDKNIAYCKGCGVCNTTHKCVIKDDMAEILDKMVSADVIVMATPVYFYSMNGQMKTLIDRTVPRYEEISGKDFYFIVAAADTSHANMEKTLDGFRGFTEDCLPRCQGKKASSTVPVPGRLATSNALRPCNKLMKWAKTFEQRSLRKAGFLFSLIAIFAKSCACGKF